MSSSAAVIAANSVINPLDSNLNSSARKRHTFAEKKSIVEDKSEEISRPRSDFSPKRRKSSYKQEKPRWKRVLSVLIKNGLLFAILFSLGRRIWNSSDISQGVRPLFPDPALIDQISDIKDATKMLHDQLQVVEGKIQREINAVKNALSQEIDKRSSSIESQFTELKSKTDVLEISLTKLTDMNFLSREDLDKIMEEIRNSHNPGIGNPQLSLEEIRSYVKEIVMREIEKHAADGIGRVDYALASGGGRVIRHSEAFNYGKVGWFSRASVHQNAHKMLQPSFGEPGQCFALKGNSGFVEIKLRMGIIPDSITLEHVAKSVGYDRSSAPKDCRISAWYEGPSDDPSSRMEKMLTLVELTYDLDKANVQTFRVASSAGIVNTVRIDFSSNHGNSLHTCLYRLRIHGSEPDPVNMGMGS